LSSTPWSISSGLVSGFKTVPGMDLKRFWRYSLHTAVGAKWLAKKARENTDLAFTIGMMHGDRPAGDPCGHARRGAGTRQGSQYLRATRLAQEKAASATISAKSGPNWRCAGSSRTCSLTPSTVFLSPYSRAPSRMAAVIHLAVWRAQAEEARADAAQLAATLPAMVAADLKLAPEILLRRCRRCAN
jgi:hypothetical protein